MGRQRGQPGQAGGGSRWEHRQPTRRAGSVLPSSVCLVTLGSGFQAMARPLVGIPGIGGVGGQGAEGETKAVRDRTHRKRGRP